MFEKRITKVFKNNKKRFRSIIDAKYIKISKFPKDNRYLKAAKLLGEYFANGVSLSLIQQKLGVIF